jgi:hypothetical protein
VKPLQQNSEKPNPRKSQTREKQQPMKANPKKSKTHENETHPPAYIQRSGRYGATRVMSPPRDMAEIQRNAWRRDVMARCDRHIGTDRGAKRNDVRDKDEAGQCPPVNGASHGEEWCIFHME